MKNDSDDFWTTEAMIELGGGFVKNLGRLWRMADDDNRKRLKGAFPEYWEKYTELIKKVKE